MLFIDKIQLIFLVHIAWPKRSREKKMPVPDSKKQTNKQKNPKQNNRNRWSVSFGSYLLRERHVSPAFYYEPFDSSVYSYMQQMSGGAIAEQ